MSKGARIRRERAKQREQHGAGGSGPKVGAIFGGPPPWMPAPGATVADADAEITKIGQFLSAQPNLMVCGHLGLTPLTENDRRDLLAGISLYDALETVAVLQGQWDVAYTTTQRVDVVEGDFLEGGGTEGVCERALNRIVVYGDHLISPRATAQLQREIIEFAEHDDAAPPIDRNVLTHLLLSITSEQNMRPEIAGDVPTPAEIARLQRDIPKMGLEEMLEFLKTIVPDEVASSLFNQPLKYQIAVSNTFDLWFSGWAPRSKTTGLGATPAEAFAIATGVDLIDVMRLGARIIKRSTDSHQVRFIRDELLADGAAEGAIDLLFANMALVVDDYRVKLEENRVVGAIGHQRYTLTQYPFLAVDENTLIMLRHQWALDRLCGEQLFFEAWAHLSSRSLANRFKIAMSDAFEQFVGGILGRIVAKSPHLRTIVGEDEMQAAWTEKKGQKPSVCDWMILGEGHCIVIDATNHAVKSEAAQGLATWDEYSAEIEEIFAQGKFEQLVSTIESVKKRGGWGDEKTATQTMFAPLVVVPDAGIPSALLTQFELVNRGRKAFGHLQPQVYAPGVMQLADVQLLEGLADMAQKLAKLGNKPDMLQLIAAWRTAATATGEGSLQLYLERRGWPRPLSDHIIENGSKAVLRLLADD
jgi:hypothetical protein